MLIGARPSRSRARLSFSQKYFISSPRSVCWTMRIERLRCVRMCFIVVYCTKHLSSVYCSESLHPTDAQVRRISWVRGVGRPGSGTSGLLMTPLPAGYFVLLFTSWATIFHGSKLFNFRLELLDDIVETCA